jgi:hypothetical protein
MACFEHKTLCYKDQLIFVKKVLREALDIIAQARKAGGTEGRWKL